MTLCVLFSQVKANAEVEREQIIRVVRGQVEAEKELAIMETKKKKWVNILHQIYTNVVDEVRLIKLLANLQCLMMIITYLRHVISQFTDLYNCFKMFTPVEYVLNMWC